MKTKARKKQAKKVYNGVCGEIEDNIRKCILINFSTDI
jgi:hypothetical protein